MDMTLRFVPPEDPDQAALIIYEGPAAVGPWTQIDRTTAIGDYPDYIDQYTTALAVSRGDWFALAWEDATGHVGEMSGAVVGGSRDLVSVIIDRVLQRDKRLDPNVIRQEAEAAIEQFIGKNPYEVDPSTVTYRQLNGLTYLSMARASMAYLLSQNRVESATLGMVSFKTQAGAPQEADIEKMIEIANAALGINTSVVLQLCDLFERHPRFHQWYVDWQGLPWIKGIPEGTFGQGDWPNVYGTP